VNDYPFDPDWDPVVEQPTTSTDAPNLIITTYKSPETGDITLTTTNTEGEVSERWVWDRAQQLTGPPPRLQMARGREFTHISELMGEVIDWARVHDASFLESLERLFCEPNEDIGRIGEAIDPQEGFERSAMLRAEDDEDDTLGQEFDNCLEMGEAETWFRDKLRVKP
jgi:hypothetical protein